MSVEIKMMDLSFCSDAANNVVNSEAKEFIINRLKTKYDVEITKKHAYVLNSKSIYFLEKTQHIISIKSSGTNYYLYFTNINNINYCFYIDRKIKSGYTYPRIISVKYAFSENVFEDTLLDGELVRDINDNDSWIFLITDMLIHKGKKLDCNIVNRFNTIYDMLTHDYNKNHDLDICPLIVKKIFLYKDYDELITKFIPSLPYKTNGLYFNSLNTKHANQLYLFKNSNRNNGNKSYSKNGSNTNNSMNSYKNSNNSMSNSMNSYKNSNNSMSNSISNSDKTECNSSTNIVLQIKKTEKSDIYELYCKNRDEKHKLGIACIQNLRTSKLIRKLFDSVENTESIYMNCTYNEKFKKYVPVSKSNTNTLTQLNKLIH